MLLKLNSQVTEKIPGMLVAVIVLKNLYNVKKTTAVEQLLRGVCAQRKSELKNEEKAKEINSVLHRTRFSSKVLPETQLLESNIRKITRSRETASKNNLHSLVHYLSLKYMLPAFAYDLDNVWKDLEISFITPKAGKRSEDIDLTPETVHMVIWFINAGSQTKEDFMLLPKDFAATIQKYCGGTEADIHFLDADTPEVDLGYESDKEKEYRESEFIKAAEQSAIEEKKAKEKEEKAHAKELEDQAKAKEAQKSPSSKNDYTVSDEPPFINDKPASVMQDPLLKDKLATVVYEAAQKWLKTNEQNLELLPREIEIETPNEPEHGDYSTNIALRLGKQMGKAPHELAEALITTIQKPEYVEKIEIAGPGFINFHLSPAHLLLEMGKIIGQKENFGRLGIGIGKKVLVEYSSPNIAKPLGVHHLLSTIIGQTIADLFKYAGYETVTLNWPGDWGTQFGKLIYAYRTWGNEETVKKDPLNELLKLYVKFHEEEEKNPELVEKGREEFKKLEEGDEENNKLWELFKDISIKELERIYEKLGVHFDEYLGERMYLDDAKKIILEGFEKGIITEGEKGAKIVKFEEEKYPPYMLQKADGTTLYATRDLAGIKDRMERYKADKSIYVVDVSQKLHLQQLFETAKKFGWDKTKLIHVAFGRMQMPEGKMSTRKGDIILLDEVIKEAKSRTQKLVEEKSRELSAEEKAHIAEGMAISAIKYNIISQNPETNITFDWDKMLTLDGNSGPYLQYAYARALSILRKAKEEPFDENAKNDKQTSLFSLTEKHIEGGKTKTPPSEESSKGESITKPLSEASPKSSLQPFQNPTEQKLLHLLPRFPEKIELAVRDYKPNVVTTYLFELSRAFSSFYNEAPVLNAESKEIRESRLQLVQAFSQVLQNGLKLLGISVFEKM